MLLISEFSRTCWVPETIEEHQGYQCSHASVSLKAIDKPEIRNFCDPARLRDWRATEMNVGIRLRRRPQVLVWISWLTIALVLSSHCFSAPKQLPSSRSRERAGLAIRAKKAPAFKLSIPERQLLNKISNASEDYKWRDIQYLMASYNGTAVPIYTEAMRGAFRCREYQAGASLFEKCQQAGSILDAPVYSFAVRIHGKLGNHEMVRKVWNQTLRDCNFTDILATARISAAADEGDVETAAEILDLMNNTKGVAIQVHHVSSAMKACWGWKKRMNRVAQYFFNLLPKFRLKPNLIAYTNLIGALGIGNLQEVVAAYGDMKRQRISPDTIFAETFLTSVMQLKKGVFWSPEKIRDAMLEKDRVEVVERSQAAREALADFEKAGVRLTRLSVKVQQALERLPS